MKFIEEYRDKELVLKIADHIRKNIKGNYVFMEVCGGHTASIHRFGIPSLLPPEVHLISGPGCPVCVTPAEFIDRTIIYSQDPDVIVVTFGDLLRIPGSTSSLEKEKQMGADIRIVFSGLEALNIARKNRERIIVFPGIGFETTAPGTAVTIKSAREEGLDNFLLLSAHKIMPPVLDALAREGVEINGFICPGHVATITGSRIFHFLSDQYHLGCVVTGFEPADLMQSVLMLVKQVNQNCPDVEIQYTRAVTRDGNKIAQNFISEVFCQADSFWRGFGNIPGSGLMLKQEYEYFDANVRKPVSVDHKAENPKCICGSILRGRTTPEDCTLYGKICTPENPVGACMVSPEGTCNSYFKYKRHE
jgi:hydrogenase expression/formation protein HypD